MALYAAAWAAALGAPLDERIALSFPRPSPLVAPRARGPRPRWPSATRPRRSCRRKSSAGGSRVTSATENVETPVDKQAA